MIATLSSCSNPEKKQMMQNEDSSFAWQIDRFADLAILRYQVPEFEKLTVRQKTLVYYLSQAALCGRDILFDQNYRYNLCIRKTFECIYTIYSGDKNTKEWKQFEEIGRAHV